MGNRSSIFVPGGVAVVAALTLAACGSSTSKTSTTSYGVTTAAPAATPTSAAGARQPVAKTKTDSKLGAILADASGKTLYTLTNNGQAVACTDACIAVWPPLETPAGVTTPAGGPGVTGLGVAASPTGTQVVTSNGMPLYRFSKDADEGDTYGEGVQSFGGTWHVVKA